MADRHGARRRRRDCAGPHDRYTREAPPGWTGFSRRVDAAMLLDVSPGPDARCFVCGPTPFVEVVNDLLVAGGHDPRDVRAERFGPTGV